VNEGVISVSATTAVVLVPEPELHALTVGLPFVLLGPMLLLGDDPRAATAFVLLSNGSTLVGLGYILYALRTPS
jgi:hypothetical protein